jgi:hypothetical protein
MATGGSVSAPFFHTLVTGAAPLRWGFYAFRHCTKPTRKPRETHTLGAVEKHGITRISAALRVGLVQLVQ